MTKPNHIDERRMVAAELPLDGLPLDPEELGKLPISDRATFYAALGLHPIQQEAAEQAVRLIIARKLRRSGR